MIFSINGEQVQTLNTLSLSGGRVGVEMWAGTDVPAEVRFSSFSVQN